MAASNPEPSSIFKPLLSLLSFLTSLLPIRIDDDMPDLDVSVWRFSQDCFEVELKPYGGNEVGEVYCRVCARIPIESGVSYLDLEEWMSFAQPPERIAVPNDKVPAKLLESGRPTPGSGELQNTGWVVLMSRRKAAVSPTGIFRGRIVSSSLPIWSCSRLRFLWTHCKRTALATLVWVLTWIAIGLSLVFLIFSPGFQEWVAEHLQKLREVWPDMIQPRESPITPPTSP